MSWFWLNLACWPYLRATSEIRRGVTSSKLRPHPQLKILSGPYVPNTDSSLLGVKFPIFSNYGQSDKPTMIQKIQRYLEPQQSLVNAGLINQFSSHLDGLKVQPYLVQKGKTLIALYGIPFMTKLQMRNFIKNRKKEEGNSLYFIIYEITKLSHDRTFW